MEKTAIEWFDEQLQDKMYIQYGYSDGVRKIVIPIEDYMKLKQQAKDIEKQNIIDAYRFGLQDEYVIGSNNYYNQTFKEQNEKQ